MFERFLNDSRGAAAVTMAITALPLLVCCGMAIDYSAMQVTISQLQGAVDAAALTGAESAGSDAQREKKAISSFNEQVKKFWLISTLTPIAAASVKNDMVSVSSRVFQRSFLMRLAGVGREKVAVFAQAKRQTGKPICMLALDPSASDSIVLAGSPALAGKDCVVQSNSAATDAIWLQGAAKALAAEFCAVGGFNHGNGMTPPPTGHCPVVPDPLGSLAQPALGCLSLPVSFKKGSYALKPGVYCGGLEALSQADLKLAPGVYVIRNGPLRVQAQGSISGTEVTFYLSGPKAALDLRGGGSMDITAPKAGPYAGVAIAQDAASNAGATSVITGGGKVRFIGTLYLPTQVLSLQGNGQIGADSPAWSMIASRFTLQGTPDIVITSDFAAAGYGDAIVKTSGRVVLTR